MFIGHYALAFAAKRAAPRTSLGATFLAAQFADLLWPILLIAGVEQVLIAPSGNPFLNLQFVRYPWSHSLLMDCIWGALIGLLYAGATRDRRGALVVALLVPSHWLLDWVVHIPDLPLTPTGSAREGLGLWRSPVATIIVESAMLVVGVVLYARTTTASDHIGRYGFAALVLLLAALYIASLVSPPPPTAQAIGWGGLIGWPLTLLPWWVDRHRAALSG